MPAEGQSPGASRTLELFSSTILAVSSASEPCRHVRTPTSPLLRQGSALTMVRSLGGIPGRWPEAFPLRFSAGSALNVDLGVLFFDEDQGQVCVPSTYSPPPSAPDPSAPTYAQPPARPNNKSPLGTGSVAHVEDN